MAAPLTSSCGGSTPNGYLTTDRFNWSEEISLIAEQQGACTTPTYFYFFQSTDGGRSYQQFYGGTANQLAMSYGGFAAGTQFDYAVYACDAACSSPGYVVGVDNGPSSRNQYTYVSGQQWFYQNYGYVNNGGGYTGYVRSNSPSGADRYLGVLQTPQPGDNLTNLTEAFTYIDAYTNNGTFYQVGYSQSSAYGFLYFAATTYQAQGYTIIGYDQQGKPIIRWNGISCPSGATRNDYPVGTIRDISVRCSVSATAPNAQITYDVHAYTNIVYTGHNGSPIISVTEANLGYVYQAVAVQEIIGGSASPAATLSPPSPSKGTGDLVESYFYFNGQPLQDIVADYTVGSDVFDSAGHTTLPECGLPNIASIQRETVTRPWGMRWDAGQPDC